jgi:hypothetical protein
LIVLQTLNGFSDAEAVEAVTVDLRWKAACGLAAEAAFHPTTLTVWRRRLRHSQRPNRIFDAVRAVVAETGVLTGKTRQALDSTILDDAVATQDTVNQLIAAIRRVARSVPGATEVNAHKSRSVPGHQSPCGDHGAVGAYRVGDGFGAGRDVRLEGVAESRGQRVGGRYNVRVRAADPEVLDALGKVVLVVHLGDDHLGCAGPGGRGGGAGAAVVDGGGDPLEDRLLIDLSDGDAVGSAAQ